ncbi:MAG TPA: recombinase family protein [Pyrinomonadaceae bacterium]|jgi:site-specific DNA recombinase
MSRHVFYGRTSSDAQKKDETIQTQVDAGRRWAALTKERLSKFYLDDGVSSRVPFVERPAGAQLVGDARAGKFTVVVVYNYKRLGRTQLDTLQVIDELQRCGVEVVSVQEPMPQGSPTVIDLMRGILTSFGQYDRASLVSTLYDGKVRAASEGRWGGGRAPFGYRVESGRLRVAEAEAEAWREVVGLFLSGRYGTRRLAAYLNAQGVPPPLSWRRRDDATGMRWHAGPLAAMLRDPVYAGRVTWRKTRLDKGTGRRVQSAAEHGVTAACPAIITEDEHARILQLLASNRTNSPRNSKHLYLLRGLVKCGVPGCGLSMCGYSVGPRRARPDSPKSFYYRCHSVYALRGRCGNLLVPSDALEAAVWGWCVRQASDPDAAVEDLRAQLLDDEREATGASLPAQLARVESRLEKKGRERANVIRMLAREDIDECEGVAALNELRAEIEALDAERAALLAWRDRQSRTDARVREVRERLASLKAGLDTSDPQTRRGVIEKLVESVRVTHIKSRMNPRAEIRWKVG